MYTHCQTVMKALQHCIWGVCINRGYIACLQVPDIMSLQNPQDLKMEEGVAAVVKFGLGNLFSFAAKV